MYKTVGLEELGEALLGLSGAMIGIWLFWLLLVLQRCSRSSLSPLKIFVTVNKKRNREFFIDPFVIKGTALMLIMLGMISFTVSLLHSHVPQVVKLIVLILGYVLEIVCYFRTRKAFLGLCQNAKLKEMADVEDFKC